MLVRLMYASRAAESVNHDELVAILKKSKTNNPSIGVTGVLCVCPVSGIYLQHPLSRYFAVGSIGRDQAESYAERMGMPLPEVERWLAPVLSYEPETAAVG